jgi:hypothetical protein
MKLNATLETSISPPVTLTNSDLGIGGDSGGTGAGDSPYPSLPIPSLKRIVFSILRPKVTAYTDLPLIEGTRTWKPYGEPFPWPIGFALMLLGIIYIGHMLFKLIRKASA